MYKKSPLHIVGLQMYNRIPNQFKQHTTIGKVHSGNERDLE